MRIIQMTGDDYVAANVEQLLANAELLRPQDRLRLIQRLSESLASQEHVVESRQLTFGAYTTGRRSAEEDFKIAEWHPSEAE
jgi:hypothetical protein